MDLNRFCETDPETSRTWMLRPFSAGDWSYATDGFIIVRVPRVPGIDEDAEGGPRCEKLFAETPASDYQPVPPIVLPETTEQDECEHCDGRGMLHDCPSCQCRCYYCDGTGIEPAWSGLTFGFGDSYFHARQIARIKDLPGLKFGKTNKMEAMRFAFDGGEGMVMPHRNKGTEHIDLSADGPARVNDGQSHHEK